MKKIIATICSCAVCFFDIHTLQEKTDSGGEIPQKQVSSITSDHHTTTETGICPFLVSDNNETDVMNCSLPLMSTPLESGIISSTSSSSTSSSSSSALGNTYVPEKQMLKSVFNLCREAIDGLWNVRIGTVDKIVNETNNILLELRKIVDTIPKNIIASESVNAVFSNITESLFLLEKVHTSPQDYGGFLEGSSAPHPQCSGESEAKSSADDESEIDLSDVDAVPKIIKMTIDSIKNVAKLFSPLPEQTEEWENSSETIINKRKTPEIHNTYFSSPLALSTSSFMVQPSFLASLAFVPDLELVSDMDPQSMYYENIWDNDELSLQVWRKSKVQKRRRVREKSQSRKLIKSSLKLNRRKK
ncbi:MAG: hypothetical protein LBB12_02175 [Holosporaceae bacterium]|jgi:hypothetical protein|nr:hypothetical protein [Holosporaceae bacterium]